MNEKEFRADLDRMNAALQPYIVTYDDDDRQGIDPTTAPSALVEAYSRLVSYGYANGYI